MYAIIGAGAVLSGYSRLSFSIAVIMMECTQNVELFIPILAGVTSSIWIAGIFNPSLYENAIKTKQIPIIKDKIPTENKPMTAAEIMNTPVHYFTE